MSEPWRPSQHGAGGGGLQRRVARGLTWTIVNTWGEQAINLIVFVVLARLIAVEDFGLVALAAIFVSFAQLFVDQGLGDALVQRRSLDRSHIDTAFWVAVLTGTLLTLAGVVLAGPIAGVLDRPQLEPILRVLSLSFVLAALSSIQLALLRRELAFRSLAIRAIAAAVGGGVVGVVMAAGGFGAWALVGQQVGVAAVSVLALWTVSPWRPGLRVSMSDFRELFSFGINVVGSDVLSFASRNTDNLLVGVFLGDRQLGLYTVAYRLLNVSQVVLVNVARKIAFPAFARLQHDRDRMRRAYFRLTRAAGTLILPGYIGLSLVSPELIVTVFGRQWTNSGPVAAVLFLIGPVLTVQAFSAAMLNAAGHPSVVFRFRLVTAVVNVVGFVIAVSFGIVAVAAAFVLRGYLLLPLNLYLMRKYVGVSAIEYLAQLRTLAVATLVMSAAVLAVKLGLGPVLTPATLLLVEIAVGAMVFVVVLWRIDGGLLHEVGEVVAQALPGGERVRRRLVGDSGSIETEEF